MAVEGQEPEEYESDPEGSPLRLTMRRREASDDEEGEGEEEGENSPVRRRGVDARSGVGSDAESEDQGGAEVYDEEGEDEEEEAYEEQEEEEVVEEVYEKEEVVEEVAEAPVKVEAVDVEAVDGSKSVVDVGELAAVGGVQSVEDGENQDGEEEKKEQEPFSVPTAGAFYMHDDRFRDSQGGGAGRNRRLGGRRLWESKDDRAWVHDRFEEMNLQDKNFDEDRRSRRNQFRGRAKKRGAGPGRGNARGGNKGYDDNTYQNPAPRSVRGRGPRKYDTLKNNNDQARFQRKQTGKAYEAITNSNAAKPAVNLSNVPAISVTPSKNTFASSLSSASPPFYPSGASSQDISFVPKRDSQVMGNGRSYPMLKEENPLSASHSNSLLRGKGVVEAIGQEKMYIENSHAVTTKTSNMQPAKMVQPNSSRVQARSISLTSSNPYQPASSTNQAVRNSVQVPQIPPLSQRIPQNIAQTSLRASSQPANLRMASINQTSPSQGPLVASSDTLEVESPPGSANSKMVSAGKGKTSSQGGGRGSFMYNGAQIIAATGSHGDPSLPGRPTLVPVMHFAGQSHGGLGVPAVGMALPGYVAQSQLGFGNSDMSWLPLLAGAASGALGATYGAPYIAVDGNYYARPSGQAPTGGVSKDTSSNKPGNDVSKPPQRAELVSEEFGQRQNKPRRYSEMNFGQ